MVKVVWIDWAETVDGLERWLKYELELIILCETFPAALTH